MAGLTRQRYEKIMKPKKLKTYVLTLSQNFLTGHPRAGEPTNFLAEFMLGQGEEFSDLPKEYINQLHPKIHTIRGNYDMWAKRIAKVQAGEAILSVRRWSGVPFHTKQITIKDLTAEDGVGVVKVNIIKDSQNGHLWLYMHDNNRHILNRHLEAKRVAYNDGLSQRDFIDWFAKYDLSEPMALIYFTKFRY